MNSQYIKQSRKFHDAWAFILYVISFVGFTSFSILNIQESSFDLVFNDSTVGNGIICSLIVLFFVATNFLSLRFFPEVYLKVTISLFPIITIVSAVYSMNVGVFIFAGLSLISWGIFVYYYWSMLKVVGAILKASISILLSNLFTVIFGIIGCSALQCAQVCLILSTDLQGILNNNKEWTGKLFAFFYMLNFFWTVTNIIYFFKVYITSVIALTVTEAGDTSGSRFGGVMKNSLYALGSICYAGLLVAVVTTIRFFVDQERDRRNRERESNLLADIMLCLASFLLSILERIIQFTNTLTLPYIAIHGGSYSESIEKAYDVSLRQSPVAAGGLIALNYS